MMHFLNQKQNFFLLDLLKVSSSNKLEINIALAKALTRFHDVPTTKIDNLFVFYKTNNFAKNLEILNKINDILPVDDKAVEDLCLAFFKYRYSLYQSHCGYENVVWNHDTEKIASFFGINDYFDKDVLNAISQKGDIISHYVINFNSIIDSINSYLKGMQDGVK